MAKIAIFVQNLPRSVPVVERVMVVRGRSDFSQRVPEEKAQGSTPVVVARVVVAGVAVAPSKPSTIVMVVGVHVGHVNVGHASSSSIVGTIWVGVACGGSQ